MSTATQPAQQLPPLAPTSQRDAPRAKTGLPAPAPADAHDVVWQELEREFGRYDRWATQARVGYIALRFLALVVSAAVTVLAAADAPPAVTASLAAVVVVAEGTVQLFQAHTRWISYRAVAENLRREAFAYVAGLGTYADAAKRRVRLASALRELTAAANTEWLETMREAPSVQPHRVTLGDDERPAP